jgi:hypothetical protein
VRLLDRGRQSRPRTYIGRVIEASLLRQSEESKRLIRKLNGGVEGWNSDEPAVMEAAAEIAARSHFKDEGAVGSHDEFIDDLLRRTVSAKFDRLEILAVLREVLGDVAATAGVSAVTRYQMQNLIVGQVVRIHASDRRAIQKIITEAEAVAIERGFSPPFVQ